MINEFENCLKIPPKINSNFSKLINYINNNKVSQYLNNRLYHKYSKAQDYYFKKQIDGLLFKDNCQEYNFFNEQWLKKYFNFQEQEWNLRQQIEYYKFHDEVPRLFMKNLSKVIHAFYDKKRRIKYKKITKELGINHSLKDSNVSSQQNTMSLLTQERESLKNFLEKNLSYNNPNCLSNLKKTKLKFDQNQSNNSQTLQELEMDLSMVIKKKSQRNFKKKIISNDKIPVQYQQSFNLKNIQAISKKIKQKSSNLILKDQKTYSKINNRSKRFMKDVQSITKENNHSISNQKKKFNKKYQTLNINQLNININLGIKQKNKRNKFSEYLKKEAKIHRNKTQKQSKKPNNISKEVKQKHCDFQKSNTQLRNNLRKNHNFKNNSIQIKKDLQTKSLKNNLNKNGINGLKNISQKKILKKNNVNKKSIHKQKSLKVDLKQLKNIKSLMMKKQNIKLIQKMLQKNSNFNQEKFKVNKTLQKNRQNIYQYQLTNALKSKTFEKKEKKKASSTGNYNKQKLQS